MTVTLPVTPAGAATVTSRLPVLGALDELHAVAAMIAALARMSVGARVRRVAPGAFGFIVSLMTSYFSRFRVGTETADALRQGLIGRPVACGLKASPNGRVAELLVIVVVGTGLPLDVIWPAANSTIVPPPAFATHMLPLASNAMPAGTIMELPLVVSVTAGAGAPDAVSWLAK